MEIYGTAAEEVFAHMKKISSILNILCSQRRCKDTGNSVNAGNCFFRCMHSVSYSF